MISSINRISVSRKMPASTLGSMKSIKSLAVAHILNMLIMSWRPRGYLI